MNVYKISIKVLNNFFRKISSIKKDPNLLKSQYDAIIIGAGHNGLIAAAYLQAAGLRACVLEKREVVGGAAVTEEIYPGFKFSRASYLLSLLRPVIVKDLDLENNGLKYYFRNPSSYSPVLGFHVGSGPKSLALSHDIFQTQNQIARFSNKDAKSYVRYVKQLEEIIYAIDPILDNAPLQQSGNNSIKYQYTQLKSIIQTASRLRSNMTYFHEYLTAPASKILNRWFECDLLKATLATDSVIGAMMSPDDAESGYVLLHHVMGSIGNRSGAWAYVRGGMGAVSQSIANVAQQRGVSIYTEAEVSKVITRNSKAKGVVLNNGREVLANVVISNATPSVSFLKLIDPSILDKEFLEEIKRIDYTSPVTKINIAVNRPPNFLADPNVGQNNCMPHHAASIHLNCENIAMLTDACNAAKRGKWAKRPLIEMSIPSAIDDTLAPPGCHVVQLFTQYTPYFLDSARKWTENNKNEYFNDVIDSIEEYAPGFRNSILFYEVLTPADIEKIFSLTGGNIFHGSMSLSQLYWLRPSLKCSNYATPLQNYYLCGSGTHPGGGVMGSSGRLAALRVINDQKAIKQ